MTELAGHISHVKYLNSDLPVWVANSTNRSVWFILAYAQGLSEAQAIWANKKYHVYHSLPPDFVIAVKESVKM